ncbi:RNA chaperone Hfq (plasmid) [Priestia koreensis]|nr:RNA chaperone Hfq [Priestia koreensis]
MITTKGLQIKGNVISFDQSSILIQDQSKKTQLIFNQMIATVLANRRLVVDSKVVKEGIIKKSQKIKIA